MLLKRNNRDLTALINGLTISALSAAIMFGAVGMYRLTSSHPQSQRTANEENMEKAFDVKVAIESLNIQGEQHTYVVPISFTK